MANEAVCPRAPINSGFVANSIPTIFLAHKVFQLRNPNVAAPLSNRHRLKKISIFRLISGWNTSLFRYALGILYIRA
jgi:hypothetical protein